MKNNAVNRTEKDYELKEPARVVFSPWRSWEERAELLKKGERQAGLYLLAHFDAPPDGDVAPSWLDLPAEVLYVGMSKDLRNRPVRDHRTGKQRYLKAHEADRNLESLYVSVARVFPAACANQTQWYILLAYLEAKVAWCYTDKHRRPLHIKNQ